MHWEFFHQTGDIKLTCRKLPVVGTSEGLIGPVITYKKDGVCAATFGIVFANVVVLAGSAAIQN